MAFVITSDCIKCGVCADVCPENAIVEDETQYIIIEICIDCGICLPECPIEAIKGKIGIEPGETTADFDFSVEGVACFGACALAPVMVVDGDVYGKVTPEQAVEILEELT